MKTRTLLMFGGVVALTVFVGVAASVLGGVADDWVSHPSGDGGANDRSHQSNPTQSSDERHSDETANEVRGDGERAIHTDANANDDTTLDGDADVLSHRASAVVTGCTFHQTI